MRTTARETTQQTLTRLLRAADHHHPVTMTYFKEEKDAAGRKTGRLVETVRTIEIHDVTTTKAGNIILRAIDRECGEMKSWRLDRISHYTVHRTAYTVPVEPVTETPIGHSLAAAAAALTPAPGTPAPRTPLTPAQRIDILAGYLAA